MAILDEPILGMATRKRGLAGGCSPVNRWNPVCIVRDGTRLCEARVELLANNGSAPHLQRRSGAKGHGCRSVYYRLVGVALRSKGVDADGLDACKFGVFFALGRTA